MSNNDIILNWREFYQSRYRPYGDLSISEAMLLNCAHIILDPPIYTGRDLGYTIDVDHEHTLTLVCLPDGTHLGGHDVTPEK